MPPAGLLGGWLRKRGGGRWSYSYKRRWFVLGADGVLRYYTAPTIDKEQGQIVLENATITSNGEASLEIHTPTGERIFQISANDAEERDMWLNALQAGSQKRSSMGWVTSSVVASSVDASSTKSSTRAVVQATHKVESTGQLIGGVELGGGEGSVPDISDRDGTSVDSSRPRSVTQEMGVPHAGAAAGLPPPPGDSVADNDDGRQPNPTNPRKGLDNYLALREQTRQRLQSRSNFDMGDENEEPLSPPPLSPGSPTYVPSAYHAPVPQQGAKVVSEVGGMVVTQHVLVRGAPLSPLERLEQLDRLDALDALDRRERYARMQLAREAEDMAKARAAAAQKVEV